MHHACQKRNNNATFDRLLTNRANVNVINACAIEIRGTPVHRVQGPFTVDALALNNAGATGIVLATNTDDYVKLVHWVDTDVLTILGGVPTQVVDYFTTSGGIVIPTLSAGFSAFPSVDTGRAGAYQRQLTPTLRRTTDAGGAVTEINSWEPGESLVAVLTAGSFTGGTFRVWFTVEGTADKYTT